MWVFLKYEQLEGDGACVRASSCVSALCGSGTALAWLSWDEGWSRAKAHDLETEYMSFAPTYTDLFCDPVQIT